MGRGTDTIIWRKGGKLMNLYIFVMTLLPTAGKHDLDLAA